MRNMRSADAPPLDHRPSRLATASHSTAPQGFTCQQRKTTWTEVGDYRQGNRRLQARNVHVLDSAGAADMRLLLLEDAWRQHWQHL